MLHSSIIGLKPVIDCKCVIIPCYIILHKKVEDIYLVNGSNNKLIYARPLVCALCVHIINCLEKMH